MSVQNEKVLLIVEAGRTFVDTATVDLLLTTIMEAAEHVAMSSRRYTNVICPCELGSGVTHGARITYVDYTARGSYRASLAELITCDLLSAGVQS